MERILLIKCWELDNYKETVYNLLADGYTQITTEEFNMDKVEYIIVDRERKNFIQYDHCDDSMKATDILLEVPVKCRLNSCLRNHNIAELKRDIYKGIDFVIFNDNWARTDTTHIINDRTGFEHKVIEAFNIDDVDHSIKIVVVGGKGIPTPITINVKRLVLVVEDYKMIDLSDLYFDVIKDPLSYAYDDYVSDNKHRW